jgi:hypothetical protein
VSDPVPFRIRQQLVMPLPVDLAVDVWMDHVPSSRRSVVMTTNEEGLKGQNRIAG